MEPSKPEDDSSLVNFDEGVSPGKNIDGNIS